LAAGTGANPVHYFIIDKHIEIKFWSPQRIRGCVQCVFLWSVLVDPGPTRLLVTTHRGWGIAKKSQEQA
jgi:hypothetical protein